MHSWVFLPTLLSRGSLLEVSSHKDSVIPPGASPTKSQILGAAACVWCEIKSSLAGACRKSSATFLVVFFLNWHNKLVSKQILLKVNQLINRFLLISSFCMPVEALCIIKNNLLNIGFIQDTAHCCVAIPSILYLGNRWDWPGSPAPQDYFRPVWENLKCSSTKNPSQGTTCHTKSLQNKVILLQSRWNCWNFCLCVCRPWFPSGNSSPNVH